MENFDLTKLTKCELLELSAKIDEEITTRKNTRKYELVKTIIQSIEAFTDEFGDLAIDIDNERFYFVDESEYNFYPNEDIIVVT